MKSGAITIAAKQIITYLKAIPGLNIAASIINGIVAAVITALIGEITMVIMGKVVRGEIDRDDLDWIKKFSDAEFMKRVGKYVERLGKIIEEKDPGNFGKLIDNIVNDISH